MSQRPHETAPSSLDEALDPELVARLIRPLVKPGVISPVIARRIMGVVNYFASRLPLMEEMLRKRSGGGALKHNDLPVVHAELSPEAVKPPAAEAVATSAAPEERIVVRALQQIIEKPAAPTLERVIDRSAPPALDLAREQPHQNAGEAADHIHAGGAAAEPIPTTTPVIQIAPSVTVTHVMPVITTDLATHGAQANPTVHIPSVHVATPEVTVPSVIGTTPAVSTPVISAAQIGAAQRDDRGLIDAVSPAHQPPDSPPVQRLPIASPESRALPRELLADIEPAAVSNQSTDAAPDRIERTSKSAARPEIQIARRSTAAPTPNVARTPVDPRANAESSISLRARRAQIAATFSASSRAQDPTPRPREMALPAMPDVVPSLAHRIEPEKSIPGQRVERPTLLAAMPITEGLARKSGSEDEPLDGVARARQFRASNTMGADMPHAIIGAPSPRSRNYNAAATAESDTERLPYIKPSRQSPTRDREITLIESQSAPLTRVRPSPPAGSPAEFMRSPARAINERPRVSPQSKSATAIEMSPVIASRSRADRESPLPRVVPQKAGAPTLQKAAGSLPHTPAESSMREFNQMVAAQPGPLSHLAPGFGPNAGGAPAAIMPANIAAPSHPAAPSPQSARSPTEGALSHVDMNALVNQVQRKIMRNLAIERSRKGGLR